MSTRCNIEFYDNNTVMQGIATEFGEPAARIYQHSDGYPTSIIPRLKKLQVRLSGARCQFEHTAPSL